MVKEIQDRLDESNKRQLEQTQKFMALMVEFIKTSIATALATAENEKKEKVEKEEKKRKKKERNRTEKERNWTEKKNGQWLKLYLI